VQVNVVFRKNLNPTKSFAFALIYKAIVVDSFITVPKFPVIAVVPFPIKRFYEQNITHQQKSKPVTTPATSLFVFISF
jgi:hypothetical protein